MVSLDGGQPFPCASGTEVGSLAPGPFSAEGLPYIGALVNNDVSSLSYPLTVNSEVRFLTMADPHGCRIYCRSLCFLLAKVVKEFYPQAQFSVEHSMGPGIYCSFHHPDGCGITQAELVRLENELRAIVARDLPIQRKKIAYMDAVRELEHTRQFDDLNLLRYRNPPRVVLHSCDGFNDLAHGPLAVRTGVLDRFRLIHYPPGFILQLPEPDKPQEIPPFEDQPHLFQIFQEHKEWGRILGVATVGQLNQIIAEGKIESFIWTAEALHEKKIAKIADEIALRSNRVRVVLIAGPSSAGKTTFAKRLTTQLRVNGLRPVTISTDDYFVGEAETPRDEDGKPDYEHIEAVDISLFNQHLAALIDGKEVSVPRFNFEKKVREYTGRKLKIERDQIIIVEGIHGLNPRLTHMLPRETTFRIYVSALTQLNLDSRNRISTTDNRLLRRLVRDRKFRGHSALQTLQLWPSVRRGENRWVFPFQREADATFNSALDYELAVLKPLAEPLLMEIKPCHPEYAEARRLSEFLLNFLPVPDWPVPRTSILREYIGGSGFRY
ncbi:MAG: nucleoside kinase [Kiritimatiellia bacterium]